MYTVNASGFPDTLVATLTAPGSFAAGTLTFTDPAGTTLAAETTYVVQAGVVSGTTVDFGVTTDNSEDSGAATGWSIRDTYDHLTGTGWASTTTSRALRIAVKGYARTVTNNAPVYANATVALTVDENTAGGLNVGSPVAATDADVGDTLTYKWSPPPPAPSAPTGRSTSPCRRLPLWTQRI